MNSSRRPAPGTRLTHFARRIMLALVLLFPGEPLHTTAAEEKKPEEPPKVLFTSPLGVQPGTVAKLTVRGLKLDAATEVRLGDTKLAAKIVSKGKAPVPNKQDPARVGDTQIEMEITLPAETPAGTVKLVVVSPAGESAPYALLVDARPPAPEKEPNDGFRSAQPVVPGDTIEGSIHEPQNVDVYRFDGQAGQRVVCEVLAARQGSALDPILTLYAPGGRILAVSDDDASSNDPSLTLALPEAGAYFVTVTDAHDQGGPAHVYRLILR